MTRHGGSSGCLYRSRHGVILGVCKGIAEYFNLPVFGVRFVTVLVFLFTGFWPVFGIYLIAAVFMKPEPVRPIKNDTEREFYHSYTYSPRNAAYSLRKKFKDLDRRIRRMEDTVTARDYEWEKKFNS